MFKTLKFLYRFNKTTLLLFCFFNIVHLIKFGIDFTINELIDEGKKIKYGNAVINTANELISSTFRLLFLFFHIVKFIHKFF